MGNRATKAPSSKDSLASESNTTTTEAVSLDSMFQNCSCTTSEERIETIETNDLLTHDVDFKNSAIALCVLGFGFALLFRFICYEILAFYAMKRALSKRDGEGRRHEYLSVREFMKYRFTGSFVFCVVKQP